MYIREELPEDDLQIFKLTFEAFSGSSLGHHGEAELSHRLRRDCPDGVSLVACTERQLLGHVLFTPASIRTAQGAIRGMGLAPLVVSPIHQRGGIGSQLVHHGLEKLFCSGCSFVLVLGHPKYYPRFGFRPAGEFGITHGFRGLSQDNFFIRWHPSTCPEKVPFGLAFYHRGFGKQHVDAQRE